MHLSFSVNYIFPAYNIIFGIIASAGVTPGWPPNRCGDLKILSTANQDTLLKTSLKPVLLIDVWEQAYSLKYKNLRPDYAENWFNVLDWFQVESFFQKA